MEMPNDSEQALMTEAELFSAIRRALSAMSEAENYLAQFHAAIPVMRQALSAISDADNLMKIWVSAISEGTPQ